MNKDDVMYEMYLKILKEELVPATGCTEPIAIAYASAVARKVLETEPESVLVEASGNQAIEVLDALEKLIGDRFGEEM